MNCPNCNTPVIEGYLFCTECGTRLEQASQPVEDTVVTEEPAEPEVEIPETADSELSTVNNYIMWNVQQGQIAKVIDETEIDQYDDANGVLINEGTSALIRANGEIVACINNGTYAFDNRHSKDDEEKKGNFITNLLRHRNAGNLDKNKIYSVVLLRSGEFPVVFGEVSPEGEFAPLQLRTKSLDIQAGICASMKIASASEFVSHWLLDRKAMYIQDIAGLLRNTVKKIMEEVLGNVEITEAGIPSDAKEAIESKLLAHTATTYGLKFCHIDEIRTGSEDLERFRALNEELYLSRREMDYLERTNEYKNRLSSIRNSQKIEEAKSDLQLFRSLEEINKDKLLAQDELDKFYMLLSRERKIREAQNEDEIAAAMAEIEQTGLIRQEDINKLRDQIKADEYKRGHALRLMQAKDEIEIAEVQREYEKRIRLEDYEFEKMKEDDRFRRAQEIYRMQKEAEAEEHKRNLEALEAMNRSTMEMERLKIEALTRKYELAKDLSPDQLMAIAANENLSPEAAKAFAESLGRGKDLEREKEHQAELERLNQARIDDMKAMAMGNQDLMKEIVRSLAGGGAAQQPVQQMPVQPQRPAAIYCSRCGTPNNPGAKFCKGCGSEL